jgi:hypothetical protein
LRSVSWATFSIGWPVASAMAWLSRARVRSSSSASIRMSDARPCPPPIGWWIMKRVLGSA